MDETVSELLDLVEDNRLVMEFFKDENLIEWTYNNMEKARTYFMTPHFLQNFDIKDIHDRNTIRYRVQFLAHCLGFNLNLMCEKIDDLQAKGFIDDCSMKFICVAGTCKTKKGPKERGDYDAKIVNSDEETLEEKKKRYILHIQLHDRRLRMCPVGC